MGVLEAAGSDGPAKAEALWWCLTRGGGDWQKFGIEGELKARGIYDPAKVELVEIVSPEPPKSTLPPAAEIANLKGDPAKGKVAAARCVMCHRLGDTGIDVGPPLAGWANTQTHEVVVRSILDPSADIAHGFDAYRIKTKDGIEIDGLLLSDGNPTMILSMGGKTQTVPKGRVASQKKLGRSLMMTPEQLALTAQDIADIAAYLKTL
ncbi:MAG: c-type cytochrome [Verrucomicrobiales bacterium]